MDTQAPKIVLEFTKKLDAKQYDWQNAKVGGSIYSTFMLWVYSEAYLPTFFGRSPRV